MASSAMAATYACDPSLPGFAPPRPRVSLLPLFLGRSFLAPYLKRIAAAIPRLQEILAHNLAILSVFEYDLKPPFRFLMSRCGWNLTWIS